MKRISDKVEKNKSKNHIFDYETFEMLEYGYEGFIEYLEERENFKT